jgi:hypothetical protein
VLRPLCSGMKLCNCLFGPRTQPIGLMIMGHSQIGTRRVGKLIRVHELLEVILSNSNDYK